MKKFFLLTVAFASVLSVSCVSGGRQGNNEVFRAPHELSRYPAPLDRPFAERLMPAPSFVLDYLKAIDSAEAYRSREFSSQERALFLDYYARLPERYRATLETRLVGVYIVDGFIGGGLTDFILDEKGTTYCFLVINSKVFTASLGDWINYRDNTSFQNLPGNKPALESACTGTYRALAHVLLHEASHIYDFVKHATPFVELSLAPEGASARDAAFTDGIWVDFNTPVEAFGRNSGKSLPVYGFAPPLPAADASDIYARLTATPFGSLYGTLSWAEDFAETFTWWYLRREFGVEYTVRAGTEVVFSSPSFQPPRRLAILEGLLSAP